MSGQGPLKRPWSDTSEAHILQTPKATLAPKLTCIGCNGLFIGTVKYCKNNHGVCSVCLPGDKKQCPITGCDQNAIVTFSTLTKLPIIKQEFMPHHKPQKRARSDTGEEDIVHARKANVAPKLTCIGCDGFFRGSVKYCKNNHGVCSACLPSGKKQCPVTGCGQYTNATLNFLSELVKDLGLPFSCKFKIDGCDQKNVEEEVIAAHEVECKYRPFPCKFKNDGCGQKNIKEEVDHENECGYRKVHCPFNHACSDQPVMDLETHTSYSHRWMYGKYFENPGKWFFQGFGLRLKGAQRMWIDPNSGLRFMTVLKYKYWQCKWICYTMVFGGKTVAKKFRAEMRLSSYDVDTSLIFNCNVFCLDDWKEQEASKVFCITDEQFKIYNKGHIELGNHNMDKNGELTMPVTIDIKMKKLNV